MFRRLILAAAATTLLSLALIGPAAAGSHNDCELTLTADRTYDYGETVVLHVSGLPGFGGVDIFTQHGRVTEEAHLLLVEGITEFDYIYGAWAPPEEPPPPPLEPGHYVVHAVDALGCEARATFHISRP